MRRISSSTSILSSAVYPVYCSVTCHIPIIHDQNGLGDMAYSHHSRPKWIQRHGICSSLTTRMDSAIFSSLKARMDSVTRLILTTHDQNGIRDMAYFHHSRPEWIQRHGIFPSLTTIMDSETWHIFITHDQYGFSDMVYHHHPRPE